MKSGPGSERSAMSKVQSAKSMKEGAASVRFHKIQFIDLAVNNL